MKPNQQNHRIKQPSAANVRHMHCRAARKVVEAQLAQPAAAPDPMPADRVNDQAYGYAVNAIRKELGALRHRAGDDGGRRGAEHRLKNDERPGRERAAVIAQDERVEPADQRAVPREHDAEACQPKGNGAEGKIHQVFHDDVARIFGACQAGLHHRKARLHEEYQRRAQQHPNGVYG